MEAFVWCKDLEDVSFEEGSELKRIEYKGFSCCSIKSVRLPEGVDIGVDAFNHWSEILFVPA
jgi:hypothetical protein